MSYGDRTGTEGNINARDYDLVNAMPAEAMTMEKKRDARILPIGCKGLRRKRWRRQDYVGRSPAVQYVEKK